MTKARFSVLLNNSNAMSVIRTLNKAGFETRFIGGCVRDQFKRYQTRDIDLATQAQPKQVIKHLEGLETVKEIIPTGIDHGTLTIVFKAKDSIEITSLRSDIETDGRHATVKYTTSWSKDSKRRDFTFNAMSVDDKGKLYDQHNGLEDLENGIVRFIGDPTERVKEDYLRILRYFRFQAGYGKGEADSDLLNILSDNADGLDAISKERITYELRRMLSYTNPLLAVKALEESGVRSYVVPVHFDVVGLERALDVEKMLSIQKNSNLRLYVILKRNMMSHIDLEQHLVLGKTIKAYWRNLDMALNHYNNGYDLQQTACLVGDLEVAMDAYLVFLSSQPDLVHEDQSIQDYKSAEQWVMPEFPVSGHDLKKLGYEGQVLGENLEKLKLKWIKSDFTVEKDDLLAELKKT